MRDEDLYARHIKVKQGLFFAACEKRGFTIAGMATACEMSPGTLGSYKPTHTREAAQMPLSAFNRLCRVVPAELMSLLIEDSGHQLAPIEASAADWLGLGERAGSFAAKVCRFQATGGFIDHAEERELREDMLTIISEGHGAVTGSGEPPK